MIEKDRILAILTANDLVIPADFLQNEAPTREARLVSETCLEMICECIIYGLNNGFDKVRGRIKMLSKVICDLSSPTLRDKETEKSKKQIEKIEQGIQKEFMRDALHFSRNYTLGITAAVVSLAADTCACIDVYEREIEAMTEEGFEKLLSVAGKEASIDAWKQETAEFLRTAKERLSAIQKKVKAAMDSSSKFAMIKATEIVKQIQSWRDKVAYSYLFFDRASNTHLQNALTAATHWEEACVGVGEKYPRVEPDEPKKLVVQDQMYFYCRHALKHPQAL